MQETKNAKLNVHSVRRILIGAFCLGIAICVAFVMFCVYDPNQNAMGALSSVSMDVLCTILLLILICSFAFGEYGSNRTTRWFAGLLVATIWAMFLDFLNWVFDGLLVFGHLTYWFTVGSLCMGSILACIFSLYLSSYMEETHALANIHRSANVCAILNLVSFVLTFVLAITGTAFQFVDGHYETGALYDVVEVFPVLTLLYMVGYVIWYVKRVGIRDVVAVAGYIFFMIAGALIEGEYRIGTTYVAVAIADLYIFVTLQNEIIAKEKRNVQKWMERSRTDELTGLLNRHAYEEDLKSLEEGMLDDNFVYVSVDVNSLKTVNDTLGHNAGDELLVGAARCLKECFGAHGKLYRIGGDEFIALIYVEEDRLQLLQEEIVEMTSRWDGNLVHQLALSCGYVSQSAEGKISMRQMAALADQRMYEAKEAYYHMAGNERRRRG